MTPRRAEVSIDTDRRALTLRDLRTLVEIATADRIPDDAPVTTTLGARVRRLTVTTKENPS